MEKYPPSISRKSSASRPVSAKTAAYNAKLREKAERSVTKMQTQMEADRRRQEAERHETVARLTATWRNEIIPNWPEMDQSSKVCHVMQRHVVVRLTSLLCRRRSVNWYLKAFQLQCEEPYGLSF